ncbi:unnamed protein product, partial [Brassica oleracea]
MKLRSIESSSVVVHFFLSMSYQQGRYRSRCKGPSTRIISMIFENRKLMSPRCLRVLMPSEEGLLYKLNRLASLCHYKKTAEISIRRNILMEYRGEMYSSEKTDEFRGYIIAVGEPLESRWGILKISRKFRRTSRWRRNSVGISSVCR